jgi:hypothetical protein
VVDALIHEPAASGAPAASRCKTFGEFFDEFDDAKGEIHEIRGELDGLLRGFHPQRKPVLWRILVTQALLYEEILRAAGAAPTGSAFDADRAAAIGDRAEEKLDWLPRDGAPGDGRADDAREPILVARQYVGAATARLRGLGSPAA